MLPGTGAEVFRDCEERAALLRWLSGDGRMCVVVIRAYMDEGGMHAESPIVCVATYAGTEPEWAAFETAWEPYLRGAGIDWFHASDPRCDTLRSPLLETMEARTIYGSLCSVGKEDYARYASHQFRSSFGNAYALCAWSSALEVCKWAKACGLGDVAFAIEDGQPNVGFVAKLLEAMIGDDDYNVGAVTVVKKRSFVPLQCADFLAHVCGTYDRQWLQRLIQPGRAVHAHPNAQQIVELSQEVRDVWRQYRHRQRIEKNLRRVARASGMTT